MSGPGAPTPRPPDAPRAGVVRGARWGDSTDLSGSAARPEPGLSLEASLEQARVVVLDQYDVKLSHNVVTVTADMPGLDASEVVFAVDPGQVTISSQIKPMLDERGGGLWNLCRDARKGSYKQILDIPSDVAADKWVATFEDGVLKLRIPRLRLAHS